MKIIKSCLLAVALLATIPMCLIAQDVTLPEYDAARAWTPDKNEQKTFSLSIHPNYFKGSTRFWYSFKTSQGENVYVVDPATRTKRVLFSTEQHTFGPCTHSRSLPILARRRKSAQA